MINFEIIAGSVADSVGSGTRLIIFGILLFGLAAALVIVSLVSTAIFGSSPKHLKLASPLGPNQYKQHLRRYRLLSFIKTLIAIALVIALYGYTNVFFGSDRANIIYIILTPALLVGLIWYKKTRH